VRRRLEDDEGNAAIVLVDGDISVQMTLFGESNGSVQVEEDSHSTR
jgi:hypothetical protein